MLPKRLSDNALDSVSAGRLPAVFFRDCQTKSGNILLIVSAQHRKLFITTARRFFEHAPEGRGVEQPVFFLKPVVRAASQF